MKVFIENEAGSNEKNLYDEKALVYKKTVIVSRQYPFPYGFILNTTSGDGDNLDCFVLTNKNLKKGDVVEVTPVGLMEQLEDEESDHNIIAHLAGEEFKITDSVKQGLTEFVSHVFDHLPFKNVKVGKFLDKEAAIKLIEESQD